MKKFQNNNLFDTLNWILKNKKDAPQEKFQSNFLLNRWLSMSTKEVCQIVNATGNRWCKFLTDFQLTDFYHSIMPKNKNRISYIKKGVKEIDDENTKQIASSMDLSVKDVYFLENALEELNKMSK